MFSTSPTVLTTERLLLRELTPEIFNQLFLTKTRPQIMEYLHLRSDQEFEDMEERYTKGWSSFFSTFKGFHLLDRETNRVIGQCDYHTWVPGHRRAEIGYTILEDSYKNKGLMTEALESILNFGFEQMNLYRVEALVSPKNTASQKLVKRFGFQEEGLLRKHYLLNGRLEDARVFSLLKPEFEKWQQKQV